jgi:hypothetical protein
MTAFQDEGSAYGKEIGRLGEDLNKSLIFKLREGQEVYGGMQFRQQTWGGLILSSEIKTLANVTRALYRAEPDNERVRILYDELVSLGTGDGWGSTNANAAALTALAEVLKQPAGSTAGPELTLEFGPESLPLDTTGKRVTLLSRQSDEAGSVLVENGPAESPSLAWLRTQYTPDGTGDLVRQANHGFVVEQELLIFSDLDKPPSRRQAVAGEKIELPMGTVVEQHVRVVNAEERHYVAVQAPFAAGLEPLNPNLATAPPEAEAAGSLTLAPTYALYADDQVTFYYDTLPKGTYDFYFRVRSAIAGSFTHPPARAEMMYRLSEYGNSDGTRIVVRPRTEE